MSLTIPADKVSRFREFPWWAQLLCTTPNIRRFWLPAFPSLVGVYLLIMGLLFSSILLSIVSLLFFAGTGAYLYYAIKVIAEDEGGTPRFGLFEILGLRLPITFDEGLVIIIPFISRIVMRSKEQFNEDLEILSTQCRLDPIEGAESDTFYAQVAHALDTVSPPNIRVGGSVKFTLGLTFVRDWRNGWSVLDYDEVGETEGFLNIIRDVIEEDLREVGRRLTWLQASFATDLVSAHLIKRVSGNTEGDENLFKDPTPEGITEFLRKAQTNGISYIGGMGVKFTRLQVKSVSPIGKLSEAAESAAVEEMRRIGLIQNATALMDAAMVLKKRVRDNSMSTKDALIAVQVNDKDARVEQKVIDFSARDIDKFADILKRFAS
ncbi:MAG: hypothetical protein ACI92I_000599 [Acidimicrobiales bacterium]|jgi:hypothetical protein